MPTTAVSTSLNVPELPDNDIWFINASAWTEYWAGAGFTVNIPIAGVGSYGLVETAANDQYVPSALTETNVVQVQADTDGDGVLENYSVPRLDSFTELKAAVQAIDAALKSLLGAGVESGAFQNGSSA